MPHSKFPLYKAPDKNAMPLFKGFQEHQQIISQGEKKNLYCRCFGDDSDCLQSELKVFILYWLYHKTRELDLFSTDLYLNALSYTLQLKYAGKTKFCTMTYKGRMQLPEIVN